MADEANLKGTFVTSHFPPKPGETEPTRRVLGYVEPSTEKRGEFVLHLVAIGFPTEHVRDLTFASKRLADEAMAPCAMKFRDDIERSLDR